MTNVVALVKQSPLADDTAQRLRELANHIEAGYVTELIVAMVAGGNYEFVFPSGLRDSLILADLLHAKCIDRMRV